MKKILLLMAIILPFVLTSCGDDKDEPNNIAIFDSEYQFYLSGYKNDSQIIRESYIWALNGNTLKLIRNYDHAETEHVISIKDNILTISGYRESYHKVEN